jgi:DNA-binding beta-propeller fold protein YncE
MNRWHQLLLGATPLVLGAEAALAQAKTAKTAASSPQGPRFEVDMLWPKPMPNRWILGSATGVAVDSRDHIYVLSIPDYFTARTEIGSATNPPTGECCTPTPPVVEYDASGALVGNWGGPANGAQWPTQAARIAIDPKGNFWIGGAGGNDTRIVRFSSDGKYLGEIGKAVAAAPAATQAAAAPDTAYAGVSRGGAGRAGFQAGRPGAAPAGRGGRGRGGRGGGAPALPPDNASLEMFGGAMGFSFDAAANEAFVADGSRNHRVAVVDINTGAIKRVWGAYGKKPEDAAAARGATSQQFGVVSCATLSKDGMVYVCDRTNNRIQVFKKDGSFVKEKTVAPNTLAEGSVWDIAFSHDPQQKYLYVADGANQKIWILDRSSLAVISSFGDGGRQPGEFYAVNAIATDSKGNIYTGETLEGKRVQKFNFKGIGPVTKQNAGVVWPKAVGGKP